MKNIQPFQFWNNGKNTIATILQLQCNFDNLNDSAIFYWALYNDNLEKLIDGNLTMNEPDYSIDWVNNDSAYEWGAAQLGLTITGDYKQ